MKNSDFNIEDYFDKAKNVKPLLTKDEARNLIDGRNTVSYSKTTSKGIKKMNILASAIATSAIVGGLTLGGVFDKPAVEPAFFKDNTAKQSIAMNDEPKEQIHVQKKTESNNVVHKSIKIVNSVDKDNDKTTTDDSKQLANGLIPAPFDVKGVNIINLSEAELEKIGIVRKGETFECVGLKDTEFPMDIILSESGVAVERDEEKVYDKTGINPRFVTDKFGNRLLSMFSLKDNGAVFASFHKPIPYDNPELTESENQLVKKITKNLRQSDIDFVRSEEFSLKIDSIAQFTSNPQIFIKEIESNVKSPEFTDYRENTQDPANKKIIITLKQDTSVYKFDVSKDTEEIDMKKFSQKEWETSDENPNIKIEQMLFNITLPNDQVISNDSTPKKYQKIIISNVECNNSDAHDIDINLGSFDISSNPDLGSFSMPDFNLKIDELNNINTLIPVSVSLNGDEIDFILWFDPTEEFAQNLPAELKNRLLPEMTAFENQDDNICNTATAITGDKYFDVWRACSGAVENLNISPNPATDNININYKLQADRNVTISVHDLFGKRMAELMTVSQTPGTYCEPFKLDGFQPGMYLIVIQTDQGETAVQRFIVN